MNRVDMVLEPVHRREHLITKLAVGFAEVHLAVFAQGAGRNVLFSACVTGIEVSAARFQRGRGRRRQQQACNRRAPESQGSVQMLGRSGSSQTSAAIAKFTGSQ